jgi:hypothetical protein
MTAESPAAESPAPEAEPKFSKADVDAAAADEQAELMQAQMMHLNNRVVVLRANLNHSLKRIAELEAELELRKPSTTGRKTRRTSDAAASKVAGAPDPS